MKTPEFRTIAGLAGRTGAAVKRARDAVGVPRGGWLRAVREARGVAQSELAAKLGFKRQAWAQFEASEAREAISLASLRRAADVLGCDVAYFVIPREARRARPRETATIARKRLRRAGKVEPAVERRAVDAMADAVPPGVEIPMWSEPELPTELR